MAELNDEMRKKFVEDGRTGGKKRWAGVSKADRVKHAKMMAEASVKARKRLTDKAGSD